MRRAALAVVLVVFVACARPPKVLQGQFEPTTVADAEQGDRAGQRVRWGGHIVKARPQADRTCFEVVSLPLDGRAEPRDVDQTWGRFVACAPGFYDPVIWAQSRKLTAVGTIDGYTHGKVGEREMEMPTLQAEAVYLWPKPPPPRDVVYYYDPWWGPGWGWGPWWGWGGGAFIHGHGGHHWH